MGVIIRLLQVGKELEAAKIYNWFADGFETAELQDVRALLDQLNT
jgi:hypothetical protein